MNRAKPITLAGIFLLHVGLGVAGPGHFHATCAFESCTSEKSEAELLASLPKAVELLKLDPSWKDAKIDGGLTPYAKDPSVVQFKATNSKMSETRIFSFKKTGILLGAKRLK